MNTITTTEFRASLRAARRAGTPIIQIRTADPASAMEHVSASLNGKADKTPLISLDIMNSFAPKNKLGKAVMADVLGHGEDQKQMANMGQALLTLRDFPGAQEDHHGSIIFFLNPHQLWTEPGIVMGIWSLRDYFKAGGQQLVLITPMGSILPPELQNDVTVFDEPLPNADELKALIKPIVEAVGLPEPNADTYDKMVDAVIGLAMFPAEQVLAMSISKKDGININRLWDRKKQAIEQVRGLTVWRGGETFADVRGCDNAVKLMERIMKGKQPPRVIVFVDEIN